MKKTEHHDGMTRVVETTYVSVDQPGEPRGKLRATKRHIRALSKRLADSPLFTFDGTIEDIERNLRVYLAAQGFTLWLETGVDTVDPPVLSQQWYAREIMSKIKLVRILLSKNKADQASAAALELGRTLQTALATFAWGPDFRLGQAMRKRSRDASAEATTKRRKKRSEMDARIQREVARHQTKHPRHSVRTMASHVAPRLGLHPDTVRRRLRTLKSER